MAMAIISSLADAGIHVFSIKEISVMLKMKWTMNFNIQMSRLLVNTLG